MSLAWSDRNAGSSATETDIEDEVRFAATAWQRYWARDIDLFLSSELLLFLSRAVNPSMFEHGGLFSPEVTWSAILRLSVASWAVSFFAMLVDAMLYSVLGNTVGKWMIGLKVLDLHGHPISLLPYLRRNFGVWWSGLGTTLPLVGFVMLIICYHRTEDDELMPWDQSNDTRVWGTSQSGLRLFLAVALYQVARVAHRHWF